MIGGGEHARRGDTGQFQMMRLAEAAPRPRTTEQIFEEVERLLEVVTLEDQTVGCADRGTAPTLQGLRRGVEKIIRGAENGFEGWSHGSSADVPRPGAEFFLSEVSIGFQATPGTCVKQFLPHRETELGHAWRHGNGQGHVRSGQHGVEIGFRRSVAQHDAVQIHEAHLEGLGMHEEVGRMQVALHHAGFPDALDESHHDRERERDDLIGGDAGKRFGDEDAFQQTRPPPAFAERRVTHDGHAAFFQRLGEPPFLSRLGGLEEKFERTQRHRLVPVALDVETLIRHALLRDELGRRFLDDTGGRGQHAAQQRLDLRAHFPTGAVEVQMFW